eukprot:TRINITY_DN2890_c0_g1_i1.p1 TRINITY_DN2890_c0_g1~~TRINITY_DN2890_c0_g1_i1.p1  ORF type:complete len:110 (+),score=18.96 TRINITY_DN2890_c0_g1_i1:668-997(+)
MSIALVTLFVIMVVMILWYRKGDLDPRFRYLIGAVGVALLILCITAQMYVWPKQFEKSKCKYYMSVSDRSCLESKCPANSAFAIINGAIECVANWPPTNGTSPLPSPSV